MSAKPHKFTVSKMVNQSSGRDVEMYLSWVIKVFGRHDAKIVWTAHRDSATLFAHYEVALTYAKEHNARVGIRYD